jgi:mono/diheme cytochrome c family protein
MPTALPARALALLFLVAPATSPLLAAEVTSPEAAEAERAKLQFFETKVRPVLAQHCFECHGEQKQKAGLRLDHIAEILKGGESGAALVRGKPDESLLIKAIRYKDEDLQMPPDDRMPDADIAILEKWVELGAPWPATDHVARRDKGPRDAHGFTAEDRAFWSFQPVGNPKPPALDASEPAVAAARGWARTDIDRFIAAKHLEHKLTPAPAASPEELVRRMYFDVHGLPPTRAQIDAFVAASKRDAEGAVRELVDALLASPRYGERWAQHWLDIVRYSESDGYRADEFRRHAWPYRDYIIKSFNQDKPYDQFVREQLAGDEIDPNNPETLVATSYLRNGIYEWNQRDVRGQAELIVTDMTDNAGEVFLGLSMGCARCHDHKFDPILQKDYYALRSFFEPVLWRQDLKLATPAEQAAYKEQLAKWEAATATLRAERDALIAPELNRLKKRAYDRFTEDIRAMIDKPVAERTAQEHILASIAYRQVDYEEERFDPLKALKKAEEKKRYQEIEAELKKFDHLKPKPLINALVATDAKPVAHVAKLKSRKTGEIEVPPAFLTLLEPTTPEIAPKANSTGRRSALAAWITRPDNPLSTRTIVNRVWQHHFGRGIAATANDLGNLGERPTHPELLDYLTRRFVDGGWRLKQLHREILLSATYRQTARHTSEQALLVDPSNKFLWRFSPRRLDAEQTRDGILAATGELQLTDGGPSQDANTSPVRSIYTIKKRNNQNELLRALDAPPGFTGIADRQQTSTPLQALLFMNGDWMITRARKLGAAVTTVDEAWQSTLGRAPTPEEKKKAEAFLAKRVLKESPLSDGKNTDPIAMLDRGLFHENTEQERLLVRNAPREGDDFTLEVVVKPASVDAGTAVRTIVSRWNGEKSSLEAHGWSLGLTGEKSGFKPRNLVLQLVGEDDNQNTSYEALASGIFLELQKSYHIAVRVSCSDRTVSFIVKDLSTPESGARTSTLKHGIVGKISTGQSTPVVGGLWRRTPHQFDGHISALRLVHGDLPDDDLLRDAAGWPAQGLVWRAQDGSAMSMDAKAASGVSFTWSGGVTNAESRDPHIRAMTDLCHVLLNANEFLYLH